ncbi:MAG: hypothetical protein IT329_19845 [Caldilineaceae bacterium]|nr:hypothetical protein [Caldilineaceae bacterium]
MATDAAGGRRPARGHWVVGLLLGSATLWLWLQTAPWPDTPDGFIHLQRTRALAEALRQGVFYPRWFPDFAFGYGHPILHYYAPASYYPPALFHLLGLDLVSAARAALALVYALSGVAAYLALRRVASPPAALAGALLTLAFPYRLYDLNVRGALPEFTAFLWPPLLLYAAIGVLAAPGRWWTSGSALLLALAWAGLALTHNLTALMAALLLAATLPVIALRPGSPPHHYNYAKRLLSTAARLGFPALLGVLLSAFYTLPALLEAGWVGIGAAGGTGGYAAHFAAWPTLAQAALRYRYPSAADPTVPLPLYALPLLVWGSVRLLRPGRSRFALALTLWVTLLLVWLTTQSSAPLWDPAAPLLGKLQFPWRWQTLLTFALGVLAALLLDGVFAARPHSAAAWIGAGAIGVLLFVYAADLPAMPLTGGLQARDLWAFDAAHGQIGGTWTGEFLPRWVSAPRWTLSRAPETPPAPQPSATLTALPVAVGHLDAAYSLHAAAPLTVTLDRFYFPAWEVQVDGVAQTPRPAGELGLQAVPLPAGDHQMTVRWRATPALRLGRGLSALGWLLMLFLIYQRRARIEMAGWLALGLVALLGISGLTEVSAPPTPVAADFGDVRLEAADIPPVHLGNAAQVRLFWTATTTPSDLVVYVHILGPDGAVIAQWDEPLGTAYRPPARIPPGLLFSQTVAVPLPAELGAGRYLVLAGLYPAGAADAPLTAAGQETPRVALGTVEVTR